MDLEELSKSQTILLTLLVSFVTSMATGIVTVSLMSGAPPSVVATVNRVIQQTVEKVEQVKDPALAAASSIITTEKTIVIKESDLIAAATAKVTPSIVRLYTTDPESSVFLGLGIVVDSGKILADSASAAEGATIVVVLADGSSVKMYISTRDSKNGIMFLSATSTELSKLPVWHITPIARVAPPLGDTVVSFGGEKATRIGVGVVVAQDNTGASSPRLLETDVSDDAIMYGSPLVNMRGEVVGVSTKVSRSSSSKGFISLGTMQSAQATQTATSTKEIGTQIQ